MSAANHTALLLTFARRGEEGAIREALAALAACCPGARVIAIGTPVSAPVLRSLGIAEILVYGGGKSARQVVEEAQLSMPEIAAIVYDNPRFTAHLKLEALAVVIGVRRILRCSPPSDSRSSIPDSSAGRVADSLGRSRLALRVLGKACLMGLRFALALCVTSLACLCLCWRGRSQGGGDAGRA